MQVDTDTRTAVIIAAYNGASTLERAVVSALAQPETVEVCVVDDASTDATADVAARLAGADRRVTLIRQEKNAGPAAARNRAIAATTAPWIAILDADDYFLTGRMAKLHQFSADADFVSGHLMRINEGEPSPPIPQADLNARPLSFAEFIKGNFDPSILNLGFLKPIFRRSFIEAHNLRYDESLRLGEDYEFYGRAIALGARFLLLDGPTGYASVIRPGSISMEHSEEDLRRMRDCDVTLGQVRPMSALEQRTLRQHWVSVDCRLQWRRLISAVKAHDLSAACATFRSPQVTRYLAARLAEQAWLRSVGPLLRKTRA